MFLPYCLYQSPSPDQARIIPSFHRNMIYKRDEKADLLVQCYLSFFSLSKVVALAPRVSRKTFDSIIRPWDDPDSILSLVSQVKSKLPTLVSRYMPWLTTIPLNQGMTWDPTWKALPTHKITERILELRVVKRKGAARGKRSVFTSLAYELSGFQFLMQWVHAYGQ